MGEFGIVGDPDGMRALAGTCANFAARTRELAASLSKVKASDAIGGPLGKRISGDAATEIAQLRLAADQLDAIVKPLRTSARQVEERQAAERRRLEAERRAA